jgi:hypothetical protein
MTTDTTCPVRATTRTVPLHHAISRRTSTLKPNLVSTRSRPVDQHVHDVPGLATRTLRLSRPCTTAHELRYELACAPTQTPHARANYLYYDNKSTFDTHTRPTQKYVLQFIYLHACLASKTFDPRSPIDNDI